MTLFRVEKVYDDRNFHELLGDGKVVFAGGEPRLLSRIPPKPNHDRRTYSTAFEEKFQAIPRSEWSERLKEQLARKGRVSDFQNFPPHDQDGLPTCFPAGTLIRMADGSQKPIEDVRVLDMVVTAEGNIGRVMNTMARWHDGVLMTPNCWGHSHLKATPEHPILTQRGYVPVADLEPGVDKVAFPKYASQTSLFVLTGNHVESRYHVRQTRRERAYQIPGRSAVVVAFQPVPDVIHLTRDFGRVVGFFLAEGHSGKTTAHWTFNERERDTFASEVVDKLLSSAGGEARIRLRPNHVAQVEIHGIEWAKMFESLCSRGAENKRLHGELSAGPVDFLEGVLTAWMDGDRQRGTSAVSISRELALNMFDIANVLHKMPIISTHQRSHTPDRDGIYRKHAWKVGWGDKGKPNHGTEQSDTHLFRKVRRIDSEPFKGYVYNISVEGDNSYVAEGVGVHNCWSNGPAHAATTQRVIQGLPYVELSACSTAVPISGGHVGGNEDTAVEYAAKYGWASCKVWPNNSTNRSLNDSAEVKADRENHKALEWIYLGSKFENYATAALLGWPMAVAYNDWSHVVSLCDLVEIEPGRFGLRIRNNWGKWGAANEYGFYGYAVFAEGARSHGCPDSGFALRQVTSAAA